MRRLAAVVILAGGLGLAGCSGAGTDAADTTTDPATPAASGQSGQSNGSDAYVVCMSDNGVDVSSMGGSAGGPGGDRPSGMPTDRPEGMPSGMPTDRPSGDPGGPDGMTAPDGVDASTWQAAQAACADLAPAGGPGMGGPGLGDPGGSGGQATDGTDSPDYAVFWSCMADHDVTAPESEDPTDLDTSDATVAAALQTCERLLPAGTLPTQ